MGPVCKETAVKLDKLVEIAASAIDAVAACSVNPFNVCTKLDHDGLLWLTSAGTKAAEELAKRKETES